jgi:NAD(P)-dependent dehydrogenase (short-subunit alcohol dehydrogenase family)/AraC-like DNA-binding protein
VRLAGNVLDLLGTVLTERLECAPPAPDAAHRALMLQITAFIEAHLAEPGLSPAQVAAAHHISLRQLHKLFHAGGTTVAGWIRQRRLEHCAHDLRDPRCAARPAAAVGARWGIRIRRTSAGCSRPGWGSGRGTTARRTDAFPIKGRALACKTGGRRSREHGRHGSAGREGRRHHRRRRQHRPGHGAGLRGRGMIAPVADCPEDVFDQVMAVHVRGSFLVCKHALPYLPSGASIVITSSVVGLTAEAGICAYATAKHAPVGLMRTLAKETAPRGIRVSTIHPGPVDNEFQHRIEVEATGAGVAEAAAAFEQLIPLGRHASPDEVARVMLFLASDQSSFITGATVAVDGGMSI